MIALLWMAWLNPYCCDRFDAKEWEMAGVGSDWQVTEKEMKCVRGRMLKDLRLRRLKAGMRKEDLVSLLGPPMQSEADRTNSCFSYGIGYCKGLGFDLNVISFCFDANGRLANKDGTVGG